MLRLAFDFIITWRETRTRPNAYANKSSYIDSFLDRSLNATEMAVGINAALHGDEHYKWFID